jgi:signal transduction histidine kinase
MNSSSALNSVPAESAGLEQRLREEVDELQLANSILADFEALVSHDIRGALRRVSSLAEMLALRPAVSGNPAALAALHIIIAAARTIEGLANHTLIPAGNSLSGAADCSGSEDGTGTVEALRCRLKNLQRQNHELTELADSVARDFRTPLARILSTTEHLATLPVITSNPTSLDVIGRILADAKRIGQLIDDYLCFVSAEHCTVQRSRVSLESLVQLVRHELEPMAAGRKVTWRIGPLPRVEGDPSMLRQLLLNLLSNSLKYTRKTPEAVIEIGVRPDPDELIVSIRDNGVGFDVETAQRLFQKFGRLHNDKSFEGAGIGLVIVKYVIQRHRGRVWAESSPGAGATFCFTLPAAR